MKILLLKFDEIFDKAELGSIDYLTHLTIEDNWGILNFNLSLNGLTWKQIINLFNRIKNSYIKVHTYLNNYYNMLSRGLYNYPDSILQTLTEIDDNIVQNYHQRDDLTFKQVYPLVLDIIEEYINSVTQLRELLPFYYIILYNAGIVYPNTINLIYPIEEKYMGMTLKDKMEQNITFYNNYQTEYKLATENYIKIYRKQELENNLYYKYRFESSFQPGVYISIFSKLNEINDPAGFNQEMYDVYWNYISKKERYIKGIASEIEYWEQEFQMYPFKYALYSLPEKPIRSSAESIFNDLLVKYPKKDPDSYILSDEEKWRWNKLTFTDKFFGDWDYAYKYLKNICQSQENVDAMSENEQKICYQMLTQRSYADYNWRLTKDRIYPADLYAGLREYPPNFILA